MSGPSFFVLFVKQTPGILLFQQHFRRRGSRRFLQPQRAQRKTKSCCLSLCSLCPLWFTLVWLRLGCAVPFVVRFGLVAARPRCVLCGSLWLGCGLAALGFLWRFPCPVPLAYFPATALNCFAFVDCPRYGSPLGELT